MTFSIQRKVRFSDCDPAGIVFYPRYFEMFNAVLEDWFSDGLGCDFQTLHLKRCLGTPTVTLNSNFIEPAELNELLTVSICPVKIGNSSLNVRYVIEGNGRERLNADAVLVCMDLASQKASSWPDDIRQNIIATMEAAL